MPSSPIVEPARTDLQLRRADGLLQVLERLPDPRRRRGVRHRVAGIVAVALTAVLAGARSYAAIASWAADLSVEQRAQVGLTRPVAPDASTFRRVLGRLDAVVLDAVVGAFVWTRTATVDGRRVIAVDGKTMRGARTHRRGRMRPAPGGRVRPVRRDSPGPARGRRQEQRDPRRANGAGRLRPDRRRRQRRRDAHPARHRRTIIAGGGDYVLTVKANQPTLYAACKALPWHDVPAHTTVQQGHGRRVRRTIKVQAAPTGSTSPAPRRSSSSAAPTTRAGKTSRGRLRDQLSRP